MVLFSGAGAGTGVVWNRASLVTVTGTVTVTRHYSNLHPHSPFSARHSPLHSPSTPTLLHSSRVSTNATLRAQRHRRGHAPADAGRGGAVRAVTLQRDTMIQYDIYRTGVGFPYTIHTPHSTLNPQH